MLRGQSFIFICLITIVCSEEEKMKINTCIKDDNCAYLNICQNNKCVHKQFFPPTNSEIVGVFSIILGSAISNAGGIGGGGLLIPILILILKFTTHEAIPVSKLMIFTGALTAFIMGLKNKHPYRNGIPLDMNVAGVLVPMLLFGTMVGVSLNKVMPPSIILISLTIVLVLNTFKTTKKGLNLFKKENEEFRKYKVKGEEECQALKSTCESSLENDSCYKLNSNSEESDLEKIKSDNISHQEIENLKLKELLNKEYEKDKIDFPKDKLKLIAIAYITMVVISLLKGSDHFESLIGIKSCSSSYWVMYFIFLPIAIWITLIYSNKVLSQYQYRKSINYPYHENDVKWTTDIVLRYPIYSFFGGMMAGLLGIGGGLIFGPLLLDLGLNPIVSTATSNFLVLFTSSSTSMQFILLGTMNFHYGFVCTICSTVGSYMGTVAIQRLIDKTGRSSILIFSMALVEAISSVCIPLHAFFEMKRGLNQGIDIWSFNSPC